MDEVEDGTVFKDKEGEAGGEKWAQRARIMATAGGLANGKG
jgi:hypothetical protein